MEFLKKLNDQVLDIVEYGTPIMYDDFLKEAKVILEELKKKRVIRLEEGGWKITKNTH